MLTKRQKYKLIKGIKEIYLKPEIDKCLKLKDKLVTHIFNTVISKLTKDEINFIILYSDYVEDYLSLPLLGSSIPYSDLKIQQPIYSSVLNICSIDIEGTVDNNEINAPRIFKSWADFKNKYREEYYQSIDILREYLVTYEIISNKYNEVKKVIELDGINLTVLKKNFVELYNILKS